MCTPALCQDSAKKLRLQPWVKMAQLTPYYSTTICAMQCFSLIGCVPLTLRAVSLKSIGQGDVPAGGAETLYSPTVGA